MPEKEPRNEEATRASLTAWLASQLPNAQHLEISELVVPEGTGFSNDTILFFAQWLEDGALVRRELVARPQPVGHTVFLEPEFHTQYKVPDVLGQCTDVRVPTVRWFEEDRSILGSPFFVMDKVDGRAAPDQPAYTVAGWLFDATQEVRPRCGGTGLTR